MIKERYNIYPKVFKELREIMNFFPKNEYNKIPKTFISFVEENMDNNYEYIVEHVDDFQNQKMLNETKVLLSIIYKDFIASNEERKQIIKMEKDELLQDEKIIREKYNPDKLFKNRKNAKYFTDEMYSQEIAMIEYKEKNFIHKLFDKIKNIIKRT